MSQPTRDFRVVPTASNQPPRQFRPNFSNDVPREVQEAFRQVIDNIQGNRTGFGPTSLFTKGMGDAVVVPAVPSDSEYGSGLGLVITLSRPGNWLLTAAVALNIVGDHGQLFSLTMQNGGITQPQKAIGKASGDTTLMLHQSWQIASSVGSDFCRLLIKKDGGAGTSNVDVVHSTFTALWQGT